MKIFQLKSDLTGLLLGIKNLNTSIGFVPTMGALHEGHLSLIQEARKTCSLVICSIFVNPTQFNNTTDLEKYPRTTERDIDMLELAGCDILFLPEITEIYPEGDVAVHYNLEGLESILEGKYRPGHFQGVCRVVDKLLQIVQPNSLFLGQKDFQQCMVIKKLIELKHLQVEVVTVSTKREADGLAMSSRNMRLTAEERRKAPLIYKVLEGVAEHIYENFSLAKENAIATLTDAGFSVDYLEVADTKNLEILSAPISENMVILIAAYLGEIRLIDNLQVMKK